MSDRPPFEQMPEHIDQAVRSIAQLHSEHHGRTKASQRLVNQISAAIARPLFLGLLAAGVMAWIAANLLATKFWGRAIDPPSFPWLQGAVNLFSLFMVTLVLVAQRHEDELNGHREILTLELAILSEHKIAKVIELLEELRRDTPQVRDRVDPQADQMSQPADAQSVLNAAREQPIGLDRNSPPIIRSLEISARTDADLNAAVPKTD